MPGLVKEDNMAVQMLSKEPSPSARRRGQQECTIGGRKPNLAERYQPLSWDLERVAFEVVVQEEANLV